MYVSLSGPHLAHFLINVGSMFLSLAPWILLLFSIIYIPRHLSSFIFTSSILFLQTNPHFQCLSKHWVLLYSRILTFAHCILILEMRKPSLECLKNGHRIKGRVQIRIQVHHSFCCSWDLFFSFYLQIYSISKLTLSGNSSRITRSSADDLPSQIAGYTKTLLFVLMTGLSIQGYW